MNKVFSLLHVFLLYSKFSQWTHYFQNQENEAFLLLVCICFYFVLYFGLVWFGLRKADLFSSLAPFWEAQCQSPD